MNEDFGSTFHSLLVSIGIVEIVHFADMGKMKMNLYMMG